MARFLTGALAGWLLPALLARAQPLVEQRLPGAAALRPLLAPGAALLATDAPDLRRLEFDAAGGALRLAERLPLEAAPTAGRAGSRLAALLEVAALRLVDLAGWETLDVLDGVAALTASGDTLAAQIQGELRWRRLDLAQSPWTTLAAAPPSAALALAGERLWSAGSDSLRGWRLADGGPRLGALPLEDAPAWIEGGGDLLLLGSGGATLRPVLSADAPAAWPAWTAPGPVLEARWWRARLWALALGDSGLAVVDFADPGEPRVRLRRRSPAPVAALDLAGDTLLVADGPDRLALHRLRLSGDFPALDLLARHSSRPLPLAVEMGAFPGPRRAWLLDASLGLRAFDWSGGEFVEPDALGLPLPVLDGEIAAGLFAAASSGAGLRYYEFVGGVPWLRGVHPPDPVHRLAWGPADAIAYVTPEAYVALKQVQRDPWTLQHWGTLALGAVPTAAAWCGGRLLVGTADGRLLVVDGRDLQVPALEAVHALRAPVREIRRSGPAEDGRALVCAGALYSAREAGGAFELIDSLAPAPGGEFLCAFAADGTGPVLAGEAAPERLRELWLDQDGRLLDPGVFLGLPARPLALARENAAAGGLAVLESGELLALALSPETGLSPDARPRTFALEAAPNPFNPATRLRFRLERPAEARLVIVDLLGRRVLERPLGRLQAGEHAVAVEAAGWPTGLYLARLEAGERCAACRLLLLR